MADDKFLIPLGIDSEQLIKDFNKLTDTLEEVGNTASGVSKKINDGFEKSSKASENLEDKLKPISKGLEEVRQATDSFGRNLKESLDITKQSKDFTNKIADFKKRLNEISDKKKIGVEIDQSAIDDLKNANDYLKANFTEIQSTLNSGAELLEQKIADASGGINQMKEDLKNLGTQLDSIGPSANKLELQAEFDSATRALQEEEVALNDYKNQLKEVQQANKGLADSIKNANIAIELGTQSVTNINSSFDEVYGDIQPLTTRLGELEDRMYELALAGKQNTEEFKELHEEAVRYRRTIQQVDSAVDTFAKSSAKLDIILESAEGLLGGFTALQGVTALLGSENEELEEALIKVNGAMAVLQGLQAIMNVLNKDSAVSGALMRSGLLGQATATQTLTTATQGQIVATQGATIASRTLGLALKAMGIGLIISAIALLITHWDDVKKAMNNVLPAGFKIENMLDKIKSVAMGVGNALVQFIITPAKALILLMKGDMEGALNSIKNGANVVQNFQKGYDKQEVKNHENKLRDKELKDIEAKERELTRLKNQGKNVEREEIALQKKKLALYKKDSKEYKEQKILVEDLEDAHYKSMRDKANNDAKEREQKNKEAKQKAEQLAKERIAIEKAKNDQILKFTKELENILLENMVESGEKQRAIINAQFNQRIKDIENETALSKEAELKQQQIIEQLNLERFKKLRELEEKESAEKFALKMQANEELMKLTKEGYELEIISINYQTAEKISAINKQYKDEEDLRVELTNAVYQKAEEQKKKILDKQKEDELKFERDKQVELLNLLSKNGEDTEESKRQLNLALLDVDLEYYEKHLALLESVGGKENELAILKVKNTIADIKKERDKALKETGGFDIFKFLGLDGLNGEQKQAVIGAVKEMYSSIQQITDFIVDQYDRQIEMSQQKIDSLDEELDALNDKLNDELKLQEDGYANNVELIQKEIEDKKLAKEQELLYQEELQEKKKKMQMAQMALDTAVQLGNLITASTEIYKSLAGIPFVGIPLAIAMIATMFGAFASQKIKAVQMIKEGTGMQYEKGGWLSGERHSNGGIKYYSADGRNIELEDEEFVIKRKVAKKFPNFLEAFNDERLGNNDYALKELFNGLGLDFGANNIEDTLKDIDMFNEYKITINNQNESEVAELKKSNWLLSLILEEKANEVSQWEDENYIYVKKGTRTKRYLKNDK